MQLAEIRTAQIFRTDAFLLHSRYWRTDIVWRHWWCGPVELSIVYNSHTSIMFCGVKVCGSGFPRAYTKEEEH